MEEKRCHAHANNANENEVLDITKMGMAAVQWAMTKYFQLLNEQRRLQKRPEIQEDYDLFMDYVENVIELLALGFGELTTEQEIIDRIQFYVNSSWEAQLAAINIVKKYPHCQEALSSRLQDSSFMEEKKCHAHTNNEYVIELLALGFGELTTEQEIVDRIQFYVNNSWEAQLAAINIVKKYPHCQEALSSRLQDSSFIDIIIGQ